MKQLGKLLLIALGLGAFAATLSTIPLAPVSATTGPDHVIVDNTPTVNVGNTPTVNAAQSGTWDVNAAQSGTWNVGISGNTKANPLFVRDTDNPAQQPFVSTCSIITLGGFCNFATVPAGKELVIEMFQAVVLMNIGDRPLNSILVGFVNGASYNLQYPLSFNGTRTGISDFWVVQQPLTRAYADPGTTPECSIDVNAGQGQNAGCIISGYLVNVP